METANSKNLQQKILKKTQKRLNRLMRLLMRNAHISKRANSDRNDMLEEFLARSLANKMFTNGFSVGPFGFTTPTPAGVTAEDSGIGTTSTNDMEAFDTDMSNICNDIRGRDRACCNSASRCFDDAKGVVEELDNKPVDSFSLMSACRKVSAELKRDKICVQRSLSRCGGPDRVILQRRFDNRVDRLYNQFYKHCRRGPTETTTSRVTTSTGNAGNTSTEATSVSTAVNPSSSWTNQFPSVTPHDHSGHSHDHTIGGDSNTGSGSGSGAIIAGAITGGIVLGLVLFIAVILWCKNRRDKNGSNSSTDSAGIFFQKRPNMFSTERPQAENNNKTPVTRQESTIYAEIDEAMVNPGYKPPVPGTLPHMGYLNPVSDGESGAYTPPPTSGRSASVPVATTRGQLSYGPILAANGGPGQNKNLFYASTSMTDPSIHSRETLLSPRNLLPSTGNGSGSADDYYLTTDSHNSTHDDSLDDYEEPVSANPSIRYTDLKDASPPEHIAPGVPLATNINVTPTTTPKKKGIKVLPSNPFAPFGSALGPHSPGPDPTQPIAKPRRKKDRDTNVPSETTPSASDKQGEKELISRSDVLVSNRDSAMSDTSTKSSHHYFVLEPDHTHMDYENSVSSPKLV